LNAYRLESTVTRTWSSGTCGVTDKSTGICPYLLNVNAPNDDVLFTVKFESKFFRVTRYKWFKVILPYRFIFRFPSEGWRIGSFAFFGRNVYGKPRKEEWLSEE
jgi:hypothetical protein